MVKLQALQFQSAELCSTSDNRVFRDFLTAANFGGFEIANLRNKLSAESLLVVVVRSVSIVH